jgi:hypothetical protein
MAASMSDPDVLDRKIRELKQLQTAAWQRMARPFLTQSERREIRNQIKDLDQSLRHYLAVMSVSLQLEGRAVEDGVGDSPANIEFRILAAHCDPH